MCVLWCLNLCVVCVCVPVLFCLFVFFKCKIYLLFLLLMTPFKFIYYTACPITQ